VEDRVCGVGAYLGSRQLVPLAFIFPNDMVVWLTKLGCLHLHWGSLKVVEACRLGARLQLPPSPGLVQVWAFARGANDALEQNPNLAGSSAKSDSVEFPELARFCQILDSKVLVPIHQKLVN